MSPECFQLLTYGLNSIKISRWLFFDHLYSSHLANSLAPSLRLKPNWFWFLLRQTDCADSCCCCCAPTESKNYQASPPWSTQENSNVYIARLVGVSVPQSAGISARVCIFWYESDLFNGMHSDLSCIIHNFLSMQWLRHCGQREHKWWAHWTLSAVKIRHECTYTDSGSVLLKITDFRPMH